MLRRLDRYLLLQAMPVLLFGLILYGGLAVMANAVPLLPWILGMPALEVLGWLLLQEPAAFVQTAPLALVLALLLAVGGLASGNELLAVRAGGVAPGRMAAAFLVLAAAFTGGGLALNQWVIPASQRVAADLFLELASGGGGLFRLASRNLPVEDFSLRYGAVDRDTGIMQDVRLERWQGEELTLLVADQGLFGEDGLRLRGFQLVRLDLAALAVPGQEPEQLLRRLVLTTNRPGDGNGELSLRTSTAPQEWIRLGAAEIAQPPLSLSEGLNRALAATPGSQAARQAWIDFHQALSAPFASLLLVWIALPLSLRFARSRGVAFGLALGLTLAWYLLVAIGQLLVQNGWVPAWLGLWSSHVLLLLAGWLAFRRWRSQL